MSGRPAGSTTKLAGNEVATWVAVKFVQRRDDKNIQEACITLAEEIRRITPGRAVNKRPEARAHKTAVSIRQEFYKAVSYMETYPNLLAHAEATLAGLNEPDAVIPFDMTRESPGGPRFVSLVLDKQAICGLWGPAFRVVGLYFDPARGLVQNMFFDSSRQRTE